MDQVDLVREAPVATSTLTRWLSAKLPDDEREPPKSARVLARIAMALDARKPLTTAQRLRYADHAKIDVALIDPHGTARKVIEAVQPLAETTQQLVRAMRVLGPQYERCILKVMDLVDGLGQERTLGLLEGIAAANGLGRGAFEEAEGLHVKHPPREIDLGGVKAREEQITTYVRKPGAAEPKPGRRKHDT